MRTQRFYNKASVQVAIVVGFFSLLSTGIIVWHNRSQLKQANERKTLEITNLTQKNQELTSEVQRLETQLAPFKVIALEKFTGSEQERLQKLADRLDELQNSVDPFKKPIASAAAHVEVTIKSEEQVKANYMDRGGYLAFVKNRESLLLISNTQSSARQTGQAEVVYRADLQMQEGSSAVGEPVEILETCDLIQIGFLKIPENSEVVRGRASVVINGDVRFEFEILPHRMQKERIGIRELKNRFLAAREAMKNNP